MTHLARGGAERSALWTRRWPLLAVLAALSLLAASAAWVRRTRLQAIETSKSRSALQVESIEGWPWPTRMNAVLWQPSPNLSVRAARIELGLYPWQGKRRAHGVLVRATAPLEFAWEQARALALPADLEVSDARLEYTEPSGRKLTADGITFDAGTAHDHLHARSLHALGATFRDVHAWVGRPNTALEIRFARDAADAKAPTLRVTRSIGQGIEWTFEIPSQSLPARASQLGLRLDDGFREAVFVGVGSVIVPDSPALAARANFRFTIDNWRRPHWPEAALLTGRSGAVALRIRPDPGATHAITRVEVAAGLFALIGTGQLSFGDPNRLTFRAQGERECARLLAHLPASGLRERVQAYVTGQGPTANTESVRLELDVVAEAPSQRPLQFRWHLQAGCGLPEMTDD